MNSSSHSVKLHKLASTAALAAGFLIYLLYRTEQCILNLIAEAILSQTHWDTLRQSVQSFLPLHQSIIFQVPGGLWVFASSLFASSVPTTTKALHLTLIVIPVSIAIFIEFAQSLHWTDGTPDPGDVAAACIGFFFAVGVSLLFPIPRPSEFQSALPKIGALCLCIIALILADIVP